MLKSNVTNRIKKTEDKYLTLRQKYHAHGERISCGVGTITKTSKNGSVLEPQFKCHLDEIIIVWCPRSWCYLMVDITVG